MAELVWKGKRASHAADPNIAFIGGASLSHRLVTDQLYPSTILAGYSSPLRASWQNHLIHGDRAQALSLLLPEFSGKVDLIYIDPPFMTGRTFGNGAHVAYRDTWHNNL